MDSSSGPLVSSTSTAKRLARASVTARCSTFSELVRNMLTLMPYFFSKAATSAPMSSPWAEVYMLSARSFFAPSTRRCVRSAPWYEAISSSEANGRTWAAEGPALRKRAIAAAAARANACISVHLLGDPRALQEQLRPELPPLGVFVQRDDRIDHFE